MGLMAWIRTNALLLALAALALIGPVTVTLWFWWRAAEAEASDLAAQIAQVIAAEDRADQARAELSRIEARAAEILSTVENADAPLPDDIADALRRLRDTAIQDAHP